MITAEKIDTATLSDGTDWRKVWNDLPTRQEGKICVYYLREVPVAGYETTYSPADAYDAGNGNIVYKAVEKGTVTITNREKTRVPVQKVWDDHDQTVAHAPITVKLLRDGMPTGDTLTLQDPNWSGAFEDLYATDESGTPYSYTVEEVSVEGYATVVTGDAAAGYTITNTRLLSFTLEKRNLDETQANQRPLAGAEFSLWREKEDAAETIPGSEMKGEKLGDTQTTDDKGHATFERLKSGEYWLVEDKTPENHFPPTHPFKITLKDDGTIDFDADELLAKPADSDTGIQLIVNNKPFFELPSTGGRFSWVIPALGYLAMLASLVAVLLMRSRRAKEVR